MEESLKPLYSERVRSLGPCISSGHLCSPYCSVLFCLSKLPGSNVVPIGYDDYKINREPFIRVSSFAFYHTHRNDMGRISPLVLGNLSFTING